MAQSFTTRVVTTSEFNLIPSMIKVEIRCHKDPWPEDAIKECFADSYLIVGLFDKNTQGYEVHEKLIGFSVIYNTKFTTDILTIGVDPDYQGKKLGTKLLKDTLLEAIKIGVEECYLEVRVSNIIAINLYEKFGFEKVGLRKEYYSPLHPGEKGEDAHTMSLINFDEKMLNAIN